MAVAQTTLYGANHEERDVVPVLVDIDDAIAVPDYWMERVNVIRLGAEQPDG